MNMSKRIEAIADGLERLKLRQEEPMDELSLNLFNMGQRLSRLDSLEKAALLAEFNRADPLDGTGGLDLSMEDLERFIADYGEV